MSRRRPAASSDAAGGRAGTMVSELKILQRRFERRLEQIELKVLDYLEGSILEYSPRHQHQLQDHRLILESRHQHQLQDHRLLDQEVNQEIEDRIERLGMAVNRRDEEHNDFEQCRFGRRNKESRFGRNQDSRFSHGRHQHSSYYQRHREVGRSCQHQGSRSSGTHLWTSDDSEEESEGGGSSRQSPTVRRNSYEDPASKVRMQPGMRVRSITSFPLATSEEYDCNLCLVDCSYKRYNCNKVSDYDLCPKCFASERFELGLNPLDFTCLENVIDHRPVDANSKFSSGDEESSTTRRSQHGYLPPHLRQKVSLSSHSNYLVKEFTSNEKIQSVSRIWERPPSVRLSSFKKSALSKNVLEGGSDDMKTQKDGHGILKNHTVDAIANSRVSSKTTGRIPKCKNFPVEQSVNDVAEMAIGVLLGHDFSNSQSEGHKLPSIEGCSRGSAHRNVGNNLQKSETCTEVSGQNVDTSMDTIGCMSFSSGTVSHSSMMPFEQICGSAGNTVVPKDVPRSGGLCSKAMKADFSYLKAEVFSLFQARPLFYHNELLVLDIFCIKRSYKIGLIGHMIDWFRWWEEYKGGVKNLKKVLVVVMMGFSVGLSCCSSGSICWVRSKSRMGRLSVFQKHCQQIRGSLPFLFGTSVYKPDLLCKNYLNLGGNDCPVVEHFLYHGQKNFPMLLWCLASNTPRRSKEFVDTHSLLSHSYHTLKVGLRTEHLGFHKALCVLNGWNWLVVPDNGKEYMRRPPSEIKALKEDLILWPPVVIIHNSSIGNKNRTIEPKLVSIEGMGELLKEMGIGGGKAQVCRGKPANQNLFLVKFHPTFSGLQEAEKLHKYYTDKNRGREAIQRIASNGVGGEAREVKVEEFLYGYMAVAEDLDKLDPETKKRCLVKRKKDIDAIADASLSTEWVVEASTIQASS